MRFNPIYSLLAFTLVGCTAVLPPALYPSPAPLSGPAATTVSFKSDIVPILQNNCSQCHIQGQLTPGMFDAKGNANYVAISQSIVDINTMLKAKAMPPGKPDALTADQLKKLQDWGNGGAPNN